MYGTEWSLPICLLMVTYLSNIRLLVKYSPGERMSHNRHHQIAIKLKSRMHRLGTALHTTYWKTLKVVSPLKSMRGKSGPSPKSPGPAKAKWESGLAFFIVTKTWFKSCKDRQNCGVLNMESDRIWQLLVSLTCLYASRNLLTWAVVIRDSSMSLTSVSQNRMMAYVFLGPSNVASYYDAITTSWQTICYGYFVFCNMFSSRLRMSLMRDPLRP